VVVQPLFYTAIQAVYPSAILKGNQKKSASNQYEEPNKSRWKSTESPESQA
jgi:hypothetical protein